MAANHLVIAVAALLFVYKLLINPLSRTVRNLPTPDQGPAYRRLFVEPGPDKLEQWAHEIPNEGLIKYRGVLNIQGRYCFRQ